MLAERLEPRFYMASVARPAASHTAARSQEASLLGPAFSDDDVATFLLTRQAEALWFEKEDALLQYVSALLVAGKVLAGSMADGVRAPGAWRTEHSWRSAVGNDAVDDESEDQVPGGFRPFAPVVLREHARDWFDIDGRHESPYMLLVAPVSTERWVPVSLDQQDVMSRDPDLRNRVNIPRSSIPAVTHVDHSARIQTVDALRHPRFHRLLEQFYASTGCPVLVTTSFNVRVSPSCAHLRMRIAAHSHRYGRTGARRLCTVERERQ